MRSGDRSRRVMRNRQMVAFVFAGLAETRFSEIISHENECNVVNDLRASKFLRSEYSVVKDEARRRAGKRKDLILRSGNPNRSRKIRDHPSAFRDSQLLLRLSPPIRGSARSGTNRYNTIHEEKNQKKPNRSIRKSIPKRLRTCPSSFLSTNSLYHHLVSNTHT